jgi:hypothetical protein
MIAGGARGRTRLSASVWGFVGVVVVRASVFAAPMTRNATTPSAAFRLLPCRSFIAEAAMRFSVPEERLSAIMRVESGGSVHVISRSGAMGCMQLMPATWNQLRTRNALGKDAFDPHDNVIAGAAYLRELIGRFDWPGALAAYNAGPNRYAEFLIGGRALPSETLKYVARIATVLPETGAQPDVSAPIVLLPRWTEAPIFVAPRVDPTLQQTVLSADDPSAGSQASKQTKPADKISSQSSGNLLFVGQHR